MDNMNNKDSNEELRSPELITPKAGLEAEEYVSRELVRTRGALRATMIGCVVLTLFSVVTMGSITRGFAQSLEPHEAATIAKGLVDEHVNDQIPEFKRYIKERVPILIGQVPGYVKQQLPIYRANLETQLETQLDQYSQKSSQDLQGRFDTFLDTNKDSVQALLQNGQDPAALKTMDLNLKAMFTDYLNKTQVGGENLQAKIDMALEGLTDVDRRMKRLADNKNLSDQEQKARRAIGILLKSVDTNPDLANAHLMVANLQQNGPGQVQKAVQGMLQWNAAGEATFVEAGKPPVTLVRKSGSPANPANPASVPTTTKPAAPGAPAAGAHGGATAAPATKPATPPVAAKAAPATTPAPPKH